MNNLTLRKKLHNYIDSAEKEKLEAIYIIMKDDIENSSMLTSVQKKELDERLSDYMDEKGKNLTWNQTLKQIKTNTIQK